jgi:voltage-gated potassium channel
MRVAMAQRIVSAGGMFAFVLSVGVVGYVLLGEGRWSWFDALYMTVVTLSTVGFAETLPGIAEVTGARWFTMLLIVAGSGVVLYLTSSVTAFIVEGDLRGAWRRRRMDNQIDALSGHVVVCGCGATGSSVVRGLVEQGREVVVIEGDEAKLHRLAAETGITPLYIVGDATAETTLEAAGIRRATGLVASLTDDRDDLFLVFTAREMNPALRIVCKAVDEKNSAKMERAGADYVVSPSALGGQHLATALGRPSILRFLEAMASDAVDPHHIDEVLLEEGSPLVGVPLAEAGIRDRGALVLAVRSERGAHRYNPPGDTVLAAGQTLVLLVELAHHEELLDYLRG